MSLIVAASLVCLSGGLGGGLSGDGRDPGPFGFAGEPSWLLSSSSSSSLESGSNLAFRFLLPAPPVVAASAVFAFVAAAFLAFSAAFLLVEPAAPGVVPFPVPLLAGPGGSLGGSCASPSSRSALQTQLASCAWSYIGC